MAVDNLMNCFDLNRQHFLPLGNLKCWLWEICFDLNYWQHLLPVDNIKHWIWEICHWQHLLAVDNLKGLLWLKLATSSVCWQSKILALWDLLWLELASSSVCRQFKFVVFKISAVAWIGNIYTVLRVLLKKVMSWYCIFWNQFTTRLDVWILNFLFYRYGKIKTNMLEAWFLLDFQNFT